MSDPNRLQFISTMKIIENEKSKETLVLMSNRVQRSVNQNRSINEINFRIFVTPVDYLLNNTKCGKYSNTNVCNGKLYEVR